MIARVRRSLASFAGRRLSRRASKSERERIIEKTKQMRAELGLPKDRRLR